MRKITFIYLSIIACTMFVYSCNASGSRLPMTSSSIKEDIYNTEIQDSVILNVTHSEVREECIDLARIEIPAPLLDRPEHILNRLAYTTSYNQETKLPNWVAWQLTAQHTGGPYKRKGIKFQEDEEVPMPRATDADYYRSGYDRGHMCPSGDNKWHEDAQQQSFLLTNICPQHHGLNAGDWNEMEGKCRKWAEQYGSIYIVCGPILYNEAHKTIGRNKVIVPEAFYKVLLRMGNEPQAIGFIYKNISGNRPMGDYINSVDQVERITGIDFFPALPDSIETLIEANANLNDWQ